MSGSVIHVCGFGADDGQIVSGTAASIHVGNLADIANGVTNHIESQGHTVNRSTVRTLDGYLVEVRALVYVGDTTMWHRFLTPSVRWPTANPETRNEETP